MPDLADLIKRVMDDDHVTQTEIATRSGINVKTINAWVNRQRGVARPPAADVLRKLARGLRRPPNEVFEHAGRAVPGSDESTRERTVLNAYRDLDDRDRETVEMLIQSLRRRARMHDEASGEASTNDAAL